MSPECDALCEILDAHLAYCRARVVGLRKEAKQTTNKDIARELRRSAFVWETAVVDLMERMKTLR